MANSILAGLGAPASARIGEVERRLGVTGIGRRRPAASSASLRLERRTACRRDTWRISASRTPSCVAVGGSAAEHRLWTARATRGCRRSTPASSSLISGLDGRSRARPSRRPDVVAAAASGSRVGSPPASIRLAQIVAARSSPNLGQLVEHGLVGHVRCRRPSWLRIAFSGSTGWRTFLRAAAVAVVHGAGTIGRALPSRRFASRPKPAPWQVAAPAGARPSDAMQQPPR